MLTPRVQTGAALLAFIATLMLLMGSAGAAAVHFLLTGRQLASLQMDREIAFRAAEAALVDAETDLIAAAASGNERLAVSPSPGECADGVRRGICMAGGEHSPWQAWLDGDASSEIGIALGTFTGAQLPELPPDVIGATRLPRYLIEVLDNPSDATQAMWPRMRIVALGYGRDSAVRVLLQTEFQP